LFFPAVSRWSPRGTPARRGDCILLVTAGFAILNKDAGFLAGPVM